MLSVLLCLIYFASHHSTLPGGTSFTGCGVPLPLVRGRPDVLVAARLCRVAARNMGSKLLAIHIAGAELVVGDLAADKATMPPGFLRATLALELGDPVVRATLAAVVRLRVFNVRKTMGLFRNWKQ